jgi:hypothetical protein
MPNEAQGTGFTPVEVGQIQSPGERADALESFKNIQREQQAEMVQGSLHTTMGQNPDEAAKYQAAAANLGTSFQAVKQQPELLNTSKLLDINPHVLAQKYPNTADFLTNPTNAAVAHDDVENLKAHEDAVADFAKAAKAHQKVIADWNSSEFIPFMKSDWVPQWTKNLMSGAMESMANTFQQFGEIPAAIDSASPKIAPLPPDYEKSLHQEMLNNSLIEASEFWRQQASNPNYITSKAQHVADLWESDKVGASGLVIQYASETVEDFVPLIFTAMVNPTLAVGTFAVGSGAHASEEGRQKGMTPGMASLRGLAYAGVFVGTGELAGRVLGPLRAFTGFLGQKIGMDAANKLVDDAVTAGVKRMATGMASGALAGGAMSAGNNLTDYLTGENPHALDHAYRDALETGAGLGAFGAMAGALPAEAPRIQQATDGKAIMDKLAELGDQSKVLGRAPEVYHQFLERQVPESVKIWHVSPDDFEAAAAKSGQEPLALATSLNAKESYLSSKDTGASIQLPSATMLARLKGQDILPDLLNKGRMAPQAMNAEEALQAAKQPLQDARKRANENEASLDRVEEDFKQNKLKAGLSETQAKDEAALFRSFVAKQTPEIQRNAGFENFTPEDFVKRYGFNEVKVKDLNFLQTIAQKVGLPTGVTGEPVGPEGITEAQRGQYEGINKTAEAETKAAVSKGAPLTEYIMQNGGAESVEESLAKLKEAKMVPSDWDEDKLQDALVEELSKLQEQMQKFGKTGKEQGRTVFVRREGGGFAATMARVRGAADLSTGIHEMGHYALNVMREVAAMPEASEQAKADMAALEAHAGVTSGEEWTEKQHEKIARDLEKYIMEGVAPSHELMPVFERLKGWMIQAYKSMRAIPGKPLAPEIRQVFDRMLASEDQIKAANEDMGRYSWNKPEPTGNEGWDKARQAAYDATQAKLAARWGRQFLKRQTEVYQEAYEKNAADVRAELDQQKVYQTREELQYPGGDRLDRKFLKKHFGRRSIAGLPGAVVDEGGLRADLFAHKHGYKDAGEMLRELEMAPSKEQAIKAQATQMTDQTHGVRPEDAATAALAAAHNEDTAKVIREESKKLLEDNPKVALAMLKSELRAENHAKLDKQVEESRDRLAAKTGELKDKLTTQAAEAKFDLNALKLEHKMFKGGLIYVSTLAVPEEEVKQKAFDDVNNRLVRDVNPQVYAYAERTARREAMQKYKEGDIPGTMQAKGRELLAHESFRAADEAKDQIQDTYDYFKSLNKQTAQARVAPDFREQMNALLSMHGFRGFAPGEQKAEPLSQFIEHWAGLGQEAVVSPGLKDAATQWEQNGRTVDPKNLPLQKFRELRAAVESIERMGKNLQTIMREGKKADLNEVAADAVKTWMEGRDVKVRTTELQRNKSFLVKAFGAGKHFANAAEAWVLKAETMFSMLDRGETNGPGNQVFRKIRDAENQAFDLLHGISNKFKAIGKEWEAATKHGENKWYDAKQTDGMFDQAKMRETEGGKPKHTLDECVTGMDHPTLLGLMGIRGDAAAFDKHCKGSGWDPEGVQRFLDRHATKADWTLVQKLADIFEPIHELDVKDARERGDILPGSVAKVPFQTVHGEQPGWYWPITHDLARLTDKSVPGESGESLWNRKYLNNNTETGREKTRVKNFASPLLMSIENIPSILRENVHDVTHRGATIDAYKFLNHPEVKQAINDVLGPEYHKQLNNWLESVVNNSSVEVSKNMQFADRFLHGLRMNATIGGIGFRLTTATMHGLTAAMESAVEISANPKWAFSGAKAFLNPGDWRKNIAWMCENSGEMRKRWAGKMDVESMDLFKDVENTMSNPGASIISKGHAFLGARALQLFKMMDLASTGPTFMGAYLHGITPVEKGGLGFAHEDAVYAAEQSVRNAHGGGGIKDLASAQRGSELYKTFAMFYSFWNHNINRILYTKDMAAQGENWKDPGKAAQIVLRTMAYVFGVQAIHNMFHSNDKHPKSMAGWAADAVVNGVAGGFPGLRDADKIAHGYLEGGKKEGIKKEAEISPIVEAFGTGMESINDGINAFEGKHVNAGAMQRLASDVTYLTGFPIGGQPATTAQFLWDVHDGKEDPQSTAEWIRGISSGHSHPRPVK